MEQKETEPVWRLIGLASAILMITMGIRQTIGLFVHPLETGTGLKVTTVAFALAVGQLVWGAAQPFFGALADRKGPFFALALGAVLLGAGQGGAALTAGPLSLMLTLGLLAPAGAAAGSFSILIGATAGRLPENRRSTAAGWINAGGSVGQFLYAPLAQTIMNAWGMAVALLLLAGSALLTLPLARALCPAGTRPPVHAVGPECLGEQLFRALKDGSYILLHAGFFTCGFHVTFLITHLPGEMALGGHSATASSFAISIIGLCNIVGSLAAGALGNRFRMKYILAAVYASRTVMILIFLAVPKTAGNFHIFAVAIGLTWLSTVPPTAGLVGKLFGTKYLATLFGLTLLTHQVGAFLGAWLGGVAVARGGNYLWIWYVDAALALLAALVSLPIREKRPDFAPRPRI
ncbi:MAG: MFS transporter [Planctomycetota bacterium]|nr:MFS transporter [Planctomycetota bacterium]